MCGDYYTYSALELTLQKEADERDERIKQWEEFKVVSTSKKPKPKVRVTLLVVYCEYNNGLKMCSLIPLSPRTILEGGNRPLNVITFP